MISNHCVVDVPGTCLRIETEEIPLRRAGLVPELSCRRVVLAETVTIPQRSEVLLPGKLDGVYCHDDVWGSVSSTAKQVLPNGVLVGKTLVNLRKPEFPVRVVNISDVSQTISKGAELAVCDVVESVMVKNSDKNPAETNDNEIPSHVYDLLKRSCAGLDSDQQEKLQS